MSVAVSVIRLVLLSDDHLFTEGLRYILGTVDWIDVVDRDGDVALIDSRSPGAVAVCAAFFHDRRPHVIFVAAPDDDRWAATAMDAGARGILHKRARAEEMLSAIREVGQGLMWIPRRLLVARIDHLMGGAKKNDGSEMQSRLSIREHQVFEHAARGLGNKELADFLAISEATVKVHLTHIFQKLGVRSRSELAAMYHGVIQPKH